MPLREPKSGRQGAHGKERSIVRRHPEASPAAAHAAEPTRTTSRTGRGLFGLACLCVVGLVAFLGSGAPTAGADEACPNEEIRVAQHATKLPDCRAWEKVSPADKNNGDIVADGLSTIAASGGGAVAFNGHTGFADSIGSGAAGQTNYIARRDASGWTTHAITPTPLPEAVQTFFAPTKLPLFSTDLATALVLGYDLPAATDDTPFRENLYTEDTVTRSLATVTRSQAKAEPSPLAFQHLEEEEFAGMSDDGRHVALATETPLLPATEESFHTNVYQWDEGTLSLAGILPDGTIPPEGSTAARLEYRRDMSADGPRLAFKASPEPGTPAQLYQRIDGSRTVWISQPEGSDQSAPLNVSFLGMTPDGRNVFFVTDSQLLEADTNSGPDIYRYTDSADPGTDANLTLVTHSGGVPDSSIFGPPLVGISDDGERVYYLTTGGELEVWDHGTTTLISEHVPHDGIPGRRLELSASPGYARVSPDGMYLAFLTDAPGIAPIGLTGELTNGHYEMYLYSLADERLSCVSCFADAANGDVRITPHLDQELSKATDEVPNVTSSAVTLENIAIRPQFLANDGRVFFSTPEALVPEDTNGTLDVYQYDPATERLTLLSSGRGGLPSAFLDASASGEDVFFATRQRLTGADTDQLADIYDARVGGGFPEPEPPAPPCVGEACQGATPLPSGSQIASDAGGRGNVHPHRHARCKKSQRKIHRKGKVRCVRKQHRHKRHANPHRRAAK